MKQQPEFTPRRGSVSSHYQPPKEEPEQESGAAVQPSQEWWQLPLIVLLGVAAAWLIYSAIQAL